jgi:hypothetical protein
MATTTPGQSFPVPTGGDAPDVPADLLSLATAIEKRVMGVYNNATDRTTRVPSPQEGQFSILKDTDLVYRYDGAAWVLFPPTQPAITSGTATPSNASGSNGDIYFKY